MAVGGSQKKSVQNTCLDTVIGIREDSHPLRYLVSHLKAHSRNIICQAVGILPDNPVQGGTVLLIYLGCQIYSNAVILEEHHGLTHVLLVLYLLGYGHGHLLADALYFGQALRLLLHDPEGVCLKMAHDSGSQSGPDAFDGAGAKIAFHGQFILGCLHLIAFYLKLLPVHRMLGHMAAGFYHIALCGISQIAYHDDFFPVALIRDTHYCVAVFFVAELDPLYKSCYCRHRFIKSLKEPGARACPECSSLSRCAGF